jgi:hypothetical protein
MPERVVDFLEVVHVDVDGGNPLRAPLRGPQAPRDELFQVSNVL